MKKAFPLLIVVVVAVAVFVFWRSSQKEVETKKTSVASTTVVKATNTAPTDAAPSTPTIESKPKTPAALNDIISALRASLLTPEKEGVDDSYTALLDYI